MTRLLSSTLSLLCLAGLAACQEQKPATTYTDLEAGFSLEVPAGWDATLGYGDVRLLLREPGSNSAVRVAIMWDRPTTDGPSDMQAYRQFRTRRLGYFGKQHELIREQQSALNSHLPEAYEVEYTYTIGPGHAVHSRSWLVHADSGGYTMTLSAPPEEFAKYNPSWERVQRSFQLK